MARFTPSEELPNFYCVLSPSLHFLHVVIKESLDI